MPEAAVLPTPDPLGVPALGRTPVHVLSVGTAVPAGRITSAELAVELGVDEAWIISRTGIRERPRAADDERLSDFAARAGADALASAGVRAAELDLVIVATITADELLPATAPLVARQLGAVRAGAFDVQAACTGFLTGLALAAGQIESGRAQRVLLIGADFCSRITDHQDRRTAPLFADAAGAVVIGAGSAVPRPARGGPGAEAANGRLDGGWVGPVVLACDGDPGRALYATHADRQIRMDGPEVFRHAVARMQEASLAALAAAHTPLAEVDLFVYHQANGRITRALRERLGLSADRVVDCIEDLGNSSAATLPLALAHAERDGRLVPGTRVLLSAFGAGFTWGACVLNWGGPEPRPITPLSQPSGTPAPFSPRV
jgi:3-oxoacyl-[acyl-carrier-protein] synthase-3